MPEQQSVRVFTLLQRELLEYRTSLLLAPLVIALRPPTVTQKALSVTLLQPPDSSPVTEPVR